MNSAKLKVFDHFYRSEIITDQTDPPLNFGNNLKIIVHYVKSTGESQQKFPDSTSFVVNVTTSRAKDNKIVER